jgi:hypothetical protein
LPTCCDKQAFFHSSGPVVAAAAPPAWAVVEQRHCVLAIVEVDKHPRVARPDSLYGLTSSGHQERADFHFAKIDEEASGCRFS